MIRLVPVRPPSAEPLRRLWLVFFGDAPGTAWWARFFRPGFRHVCAAAWFDDQQRWVFYNPTRRGTVIELYSGAEFDARLGELLLNSAAVLRVPSEFARGATPAGWHCVGAIKALLGIRTCALAPHGLYLDLRARGAETVEVEQSVRAIWRQHAAAAG